jgi:hypothetical protein
MDEKRREKIPRGKIKEDSREIVSCSAVVCGLAPVRGQAPTPLFVASQRPDPIASHKSAARPHCRGKTLSL